MSVIQKIQEKYAKLMAVIIAVALMTFVVMLAFEKGGSMFRGGNSTAVGKVNGKKIEYNDFLKKVNQQEQSLQAQYAQYGGATPPGLHQQAVDNAWNQEVNLVLQTNELQKLGVQLGKKERGDMLYGANPPEDLKKAFTDPKTGFYNGQQAKQQIDMAIKRKKGTEQELAQRDQLIAYLDYLDNMRLTEKYNSLLGNSTNIPKWFIEKENADKSLLAKISLVRESYTSIADSAIKITDKEIRDYVDKHKEDYKQEESRSIAYVTFSALPVAADSAAARERLLQLKEEFDSTKDINQFLAAQGMQTFYDGYVAGSKIQSSAKDSIFKIPVGSIYGPYIDGDSYSLAKLLGVRKQPDSVTVRHILIATSQRDPQSGQMYSTRDTASAYKLIDSIRTAIRNGSNFDTLAAKLSEDPGSKDKGGKYENVESGAMTTEFNEFIFGNPAGSKGIVKTEFGYHYIEILSAKGSSSAYKIATLSKPIEVSQETDNNASNEAALFAGDSRDQKTFDANVEKLKTKGINKKMAIDIKPTSSEVQGLGSSRTFVKNIYKAKAGEVLEPEKVGDNWVVAIVTEVNEEGTQPVAKARPKVELILRNKKKAEQLTKKAGNITTLEAAAAAFGGKQIETVDSLRMTGTQTALGMTIASEPKVIGAAFNPANKGKVVPQVIEGTSGIYIVRVDNIAATSVSDANVAEQRKARYQEAKQQAAYRSPIQALREAATIKDRRRDFF
jgi:peptidyl-prolyl cis-trans isomerase D